MNLLFLLALLLFSSACGELPQRHPPARTPVLMNEGGQTREGFLEFRFIDVGQGDSTLITTPNGQFILIDSGVREMGKKRVLPLLVEKDLALIVASHFDADHIGGIPEIFKGPDGVIGTTDDLIPTQGILDRGSAATIDTGDLSDYWVTASKYRFSLEPGDEFTIDDVRFSIVAENGRFSDGTFETTDPENENAHGLSILIQYGDVSYLTSGDLPGPNFENHFEPINLEAHLPKIVGDIDILHVSHHGSHQSTSKKFVEALKPEIAIVSTGENNYGHPHPIVLENLISAGSKIYLTEGDWIENKEGLNIMNGDICLQTNGKDITIGNCL